MTGVDMGEADVDQPFGPSAPSSRARSESFSASCVPSAAMPP
jgi:hypothetical protein